MRKIKSFERQTAFIATLLFKICKTGHKKHLTIPDSDVIDIFYELKQSYPECFNALYFSVSVGSTQCRSKDVEKIFKILLKQGIIYRQTGKVVSKLKGMLAIHPEKCEFKKQMMLLKGFYITEKQITEIAEKFNEKEACISFDNIVNCNCGKCFSCSVKKQNEIMERIRPDRHIYKTV